MSSVLHQSASSAGATLAGESKTSTHDDRLSTLSVRPRLFRICDMSVSGGDPTNDRDRQTRAEAALHSGGASYRLIVDTIPALIATMTPEGEVEHVDPQFHEYFGRTFEELKQWGTSDAVHPDDLPQVIDAWRGRALTEGLPVRNRTPYARR